MKTEPSQSPNRSSRTSARPRSADRAAELSLDRRALLPPGTPALVAVSGGRDSVALLHALFARGEKALVVCHFDHALRPESADDAAFVAGLAREYRLPFESARASALSKRRSVETAAREARYAFLTEVAGRLEIPRLFLAHHANDQAETFLFHLLRGSGATGLRGMRAISQRGSLTLHRPLLGTWREEIDRYAVAHALRHREDVSNLDLQHTRNRLRHEILPALEAALGRHVRPALWRAADILAAEDELLSSLTPVLGPGVAFELTTLRSLPLALQRRAVHTWLRENGVANIAYDDIEAVLRLATQATPAKVNLSSGRHACRRAGRLFLV